MKNRLGASAGAGPRRRAAGTDAGKLGTADTGEDEDQGKGETKGELNNEPNTVTCRYYPRRNSSALSHWKRPADC